MAAERPLICMVDDEQRLDRASAQALGFLARRLAADPVGLVFAARGSILKHWVVVAGVPEPAARQQARTMNGVGSTEFRR